jgi:hypothetical protein
MRSFAHHVIRRSIARVIDERLAHELRIATSTTRRTGRRE